MLTTHCYHHCCLTLACSLGLLATLSVASAGEINYGNVRPKYSKTPPVGFKEAMKRDYQEDKPNSCAIRLAFALEAVDGAFFSSFKSNAVFKRKPIRAKELSDYLMDQLPGGTSIQSRQSIAGRQGIIYFGKIKNSNVSGHISLWDGMAVVDNGDYFARAQYVYFWPLD